MAARHLIVTGGTGYIGARLVETARKQGRRVTLLGRTTTAPGGERCAWLLGEPLPAAAIDEALPAADQALVHLAHDWRADDDVNIEGSAALFASAQAAGIGTRVFISSQSARPDALNRYGRMKWRAEQRVAAEASLRVGLVYGGPRRAMYGLLCRIVRLPLLPMVEPHRPVQPIHLDEVVAGILAAADGRAGGVLALAGPDPVPFGTVLRHMAERFGGARLRIVPVPIRLALLACDLTMRMPFGPKVDRERVLGLAGTEPIASSADLAALGIDVAPFAARLADEPAGRRARLAEGRAFLRYLGIAPGAALVRRYAAAVDGAIARPRFLLGWREPVGGSTALATRLRIASRLVEASGPGEAMLAAGSRPRRIGALLWAGLGEALRLPTRLIATAVAR